MSWRRALCISVVLCGCQSTPPPSHGKKHGKVTKAALEHGQGDDTAGPSSGGEEVVTTQVGQDPALEATVPTAILSEALVSLDDALRKEPKDPELLQSELVLLRIYGQNLEQYRDTQARLGALGGKSPWFFLEAAYGAQRQKNFLLAGYFLTKAAAASGGDALVNAAVLHGRGLSDYLSGRRFVGLAQIRKSALGTPAYEPALMTIGFIALHYGDPVGGERYFRALTALRPGSIHGRLGLASALRVKGDAAEALGVLEPLYRKYKSDRRVAWNYALTLSQIPGSEQKAIDVLASYFQLPGSLGEFDVRASGLSNRLSAAMSLKKQEEAAAKAAPPRDEAKAPASAKEADPKSSDPKSPALIKAAAPRQAAPPGVGK